jgi:hypothetical protein
MVYGIWLWMVLCNNRELLIIILVYVFGKWLRYILGTWLRQVVDELTHTLGV